MMPGAAEAYRTFAIHSCDTETRYRRDESWETETFTLENWSDQAADALMVECLRIEKVQQEIESACSGTALAEELSPWLVEFGKLGRRCRKAIELARMYRDGADRGTMAELYRENLMDDEDRALYGKHKCGTLKLQPFYEKMMDDIGKILYIHGDL